MRSAVLILALAVWSAHLSLGAEPGEIACTLDDWHRTSKLATVRDGMLHLEASGTEQTRLFRRDEAYADVRLEVDFRVESAGRGVRAVGLVFGSTDSLNYHYVHIDRWNAILCHSDDAEGWTEIRRHPVPRRRPGAWYTARVETSGSEIRIFYEGKLLYAARSQQLRPGLVGVYAGQAKVWIRKVSISGKRAKLARGWTMRKRPRLFVYVCKDGGAGAYEAFPDVCRLADGRLMAVFYDGYGHVSLPNAAHPKGGRVSCCTSSDEGRTWSPPSVLYDDEADNRDPHIAQLRDGTLICTFFSLRPAKGRRWQGSGAQLVRSADGGKTWDKTPASVSKDYYCSAPVREMPDGTLLLGLYHERGGRAWGAVTRSTDQGRTWGKPVDIPNAGRYLDAETDTILLKDGSLFAALRGRKEMCHSRSTDGGKTWTPAESFGFPGHCPYLYRTSKGIILLAHRLPSTSLHYSLDETKTWSRNVLIDRVGGAYPSLVERKDGTVLCVYYEEGPGSNIRACRLRVTRTGVKVIAFEEEP